MKLKSALAMLLCALLLFTPVFAESESNRMQTTLAHAKTVLNVPEEYTDFSYYSQTDADGTVYWSFSWSADKKGNLEATFSEDGFLSSYYAWVYTESYDDSLAKFTHAEAKAIAEAFLDKVNPEIFPYLREVTADGDDRNSRTASFLFREYRNDIPSFSNTVSVTVDKYHGIVRNYQSAKRVDDFSDTDVKITEPEAKALYLRDIGIRMEYRMAYDYKTQDYKVFPVYILKDTQGKAVDAVTGETLTPDFPESYLFGTLTNGAMADSSLKQEASAERVQFTPEELEALSNVSEVLAKEEALNNAMKKIPALKAFTLKSASLQRDYRDETKLTWHFDLNNENNAYANVQMNAKTGQLLGFSLPQNNSENKTFTEADAKKIAEAFLRAEASDVFDKTEYTEDEKYYIPAFKEGKLPSAYYITYQRMKNGIPVSGNALTVRVDADTKQVGFYTRSFIEGLTFPDISGCMSEEDILEVMDETMEFTLVYLPKTDKNQQAYTFLNPQGQAFDPYTGARLSYDGTPIEEAFIPDYTDIKGHWAKDMVLALLDNGYYFSNSEFGPDKTITKKEFLKFFRMIGNDTDEEINKLIAKIEEIPEEKADANAVMTKEELSCYFIYQMGYGKIAAVDEMFRYPFVDAYSAEETLQGDITILAGLGVFKGSPNGYFHPKKELTRAEAASAVYHYLKNVR